MDLGLEGRTAFVAASTRGLGYACARSLAREGAIVTIDGRDGARVASAVERLRTEVPTARVAGIAADISSASGRALVFRELPDTDILVTNNAGPPPGSLAEWDEQALIDALRANTVPAVELMRHYLPGMRTRGFGRVVNITSAMVKSPAADMGLSTSARAALTAISKSIGREAAADGVTINNLLPERFDTDRGEFMTERRMRTDGIDREEARRRIAATIPAGRLGRPEEFGDACAYLCSAQAGYITGQNLQLDGGSYRGLV